MRILKTVSEYVAAINGQWMKAPGVKLILVHWPIRI